MSRWAVERVVHFEPGEICKEGFVQFGFHDLSGRQYVLEHQKHFLGMILPDGRLGWTVAAHEVFTGVQNIAAKIQYPIYIDSLPDGKLVVSNFGDGRLFLIDLVKMRSEIFVDGPSLGIRHAGNCVVDHEGCVWVNEVDGCRIWQFSPTGKSMLVLGDGKPGFQSVPVEFESASFSWIYDLRIGPDGNIYVLDSKNFAVRMIDLRERMVRLIAGTGKAGYSGDGGLATQATFGSDSHAKFDGPISMSVDEAANVFVGDRFNHVVRMIHRSTGIIETIAGRKILDNFGKNNPNESDPYSLSLPAISSMDYYNRRLLVPTDLPAGAGELAVLRRAK